MRQRRAEPAAPKRRHRCKHKQPSSPNPHPLKQSCLSLGLLCARIVVRRSKSLSNLKPLNSANEERGSTRHSAGATPQAPSGKLSCAGASPFAGRGYTCSASCVLSAPFLRGFAEDDSQEARTGGVSATGGARSYARGLQSGLRLPSLSALAGRRASCFIKLSTAYWLVNR